MIVDEEHIHLLAESPELEGRIGELLEIVNHSRPFRVAIDVTDSRQVVFVGVNDTRSIPVPPKVSGASDVLVVPDGYPGVEILHGSVQILFGSGGNYMVMVCHEDDMMDKKAIFFVGFLQCLEEYADDMSLVEPKGSIVCPADQMVG